MNKTTPIILLLAAMALFGGGCQRNQRPRYLVVSEAVHFELQPGRGTLGLPMFPETQGTEAIVRDVSQAEHYYQKLSAIYGLKSFRFVADSTKELLLAHSGPLPAPQQVYSFRDDAVDVELSLLAFEDSTAHYIFRERHHQSGRVREHPVDVPVGQSTSIGLVVDSAANRSCLLAISVQALAVTRDLTPDQLADFLRDKNTPRGVHSASGYRTGDQRWMDEIFGERGLRLAVDADSSIGTEPFDIPPEPVGGMQALVERFKYPESAIRDTLEGRVLVEARIDEQGKIRFCRVVRGVRRDLDSAAINTVRDLQFTPAQRQGQSVAATVMIPINFQLH